LVLSSDHESVAGRPESLAQEFLDSVYIGGYVPGEKSKCQVVGRGPRIHTVINHGKLQKTADVGDMQDIATPEKVSHIEFRFGLSNLIIVLKKESQKGKGREFYFSKVGLIALLKMADMISMYPPSLVGRPEGRRPKT
jgi:hypothetical protein